MRPISRQVGIPLSLVGLTLALSAGACSDDATGLDPTVDQQEAVVVRIDPSSATIGVGETIQLAAIPRGGGDKAAAGHNVFWSSDEESVASVSANGLVTGIAVGTATIVAAGKGQDKHGQGASANITVVDQQTITQLPVLPGAEGFGVTTPAGRGGAVLRVRNLRDSGPGSLREALATPGPRTIVFEVGGTIVLSSDLDILDPFVTLAGQTAPSPGITLRGAGLRVRSHDVLVQHIRVRVGDAASGPDPRIRDGVQVLGSQSYNVVIDHISASWAIDEVMSTWYPLHDVTFSHSIIAEGLHESSHPKGAHSTGLLIGDGSERVAIIGNLFAHNFARNPLLKGGTSSIVVNNLVYNPGYRSIRVSDADDSGPSLASIVGNVLVPGPSTVNDYLVSVGSTVKEGTQVYVNDNLAPIPLRISSGLLFDPLVSTPPIWADPLTVRPASNVQTWVLEHAGARPQDRDAVDLRLVNEVLSGGGSIIDSQSEVGGWPALQSVQRPLELPADPTGDSDGDGYTNLEEWLQDLAAALEGRS